MSLTLTKGNGYTVKATSMINLFSSFFVPIDNDTTPFARVINALTEAKEDDEAITVNSYVHKKYHGYLSMEFFSIAPDSQSGGTGLFRVSGKIVLTKADAASMSVHPQVSIPNPSLQHNFGISNNNTAIVNFVSQKLSTMLENTILPVFKALVGNSNNVLALQRPVPPARAAMYRVLRGCDTARCAKDVVADWTRDACSVQQLARIPRPCSLPRDFESGLVASEDKVKSRINIVICFPQAEGRVGRVWSSRSVDR